jgi:formamidopyrimidine-DNA glycosylase
MPELPEVEVTRLGLLPHLPGRKIISLFQSGKQLRLPIPPLTEYLCGRTIASLDRRAKYLLIRLENTAVLVIHLGMTGKLGLFTKTAARKSHDHLCLELDSGLELRFNDARRFGSIVFWPNDTAEQLEDEFNYSQGIEPFGPDFTAANLAQLAKGRRQPIKIFLMDGRRISGIGNIYANETLFAAKIHPQSPAGSLDKEQWQRLTACAVMILKQAIAAGGSTIHDFLGASGQPGHFQLQLAVYGKKEQPCPVCEQKISKEQIGGRATFFCPICQQVQK